MRFQRLDLNLLVVLEALLSERSVSLAAERICLSQSATSSALARLRKYFADDLLIVKGRQMVLTKRAQGLVEPVRAVLDQIHRTIAVTPQFDPATSDRTIRILGSDYVTEVLLSLVLRELETAAPNMRVEIMSLGDNPVEAMERGQVDLLMTVDFALSGDHPSQVLFEDDFVVIGCKDNPALAAPMTRECYFELGHVTARFGKGNMPAFEDWFVRRQKQQRRLDVIAPSFLSIPGLVIGTRRIATVHRRHALRLVDYLPIKVVEPPMPFPPIREAAQWHMSNANDPAIRWFVEQAVLAANAYVKVDALSNVVPLDPSRTVPLSNEDFGQLRADLGIKN